MKTLYALIALIILSTLPMIAHADEFGERFWNKSGLAFMDPQDDSATAEENQIMASGASETSTDDMDEAAAALQDIMPAAGDETTPDTISEQDFLLEENTDTELGP